MDNLLLTNLKMNLDAMSLCDLISNQTIQYVSNGSAPQFQGSFGWMLSLNQHELCYCSGPAARFQIKCYQAELFGITSALTFLHKLQTYTNDPRHVR